MWWFLPKPRCLTAGGKPGWRHYCASPNSARPDEFCLPAMAVAHTEISHQVYLRHRHPFSSRQQSWFMRATHTSASFGISAERSSKKNYMQVVQNKIVCVRDRKHTCTGNVHVCILVNIAHRGPLKCLQPTHRGHFLQSGLTSKKWHVLAFPSNFVNTFQAEKIKGLNRG